MKSSVLFLALLFSCAGCSHIRVVAFDKKANTVSIQAGRWDTQEAAQKQAEEYCGTAATLLRMEERIVGVYTSANAAGDTQTYGKTAYGSAYGSAVSTGIPQKVYTFSCGSEPVSGSH